MHQRRLPKPSRSPRSALVFGAFIVPLLRRGSTARWRGILGRAVRCNGEALDGAQETVHALRRRPHRGGCISYLVPRSYTHAHGQSAEWKRRVELSRDTGLVAVVLSLPPDGTCRSTRMMSRRGVGRGGLGSRRNTAPLSRGCVFQANSFTLRGT
jgi:hypothetical protein